MLGFLPERMGIIGEHPEGGVRIDVERPVLGGPPWRYEGDAVTPTGRHRVVIDVESDGTVQVRTSEAAPPPPPEPVRTPEAPSAEGADLSTPVRLIMRAAWKHAHAEGAPPPRRVVRWRPDR
jgi:hypothetical protein